MTAVDSEQYGEYWEPSGQTLVQQIGKAGRTGNLGELQVVVAAWRSRSQENKDAVLHICEHRDTALYESVIRDDPFTFSYILDLQRLLDWKRHDCGDMLASRRIIEEVLARPTTEMLQILLDHGWDLGRGDAEFNHYEVIM
jgi:hypothetical protein